MDHAAAKYSDLGDRLMTAKSALKVTFFSSKASNWPQPCLEPSVVILDPILRILLSVMNRVRQQLIDDAKQPCVLRLRVGLVVRR